MHNLVLLCKTYRGDLNRFQILKSSIDKHNADNIPFYIVCPENDIQLIKNTTYRGDEKYDIHFISDETIYAANNINTHEQNWLAQQIIKLGFYKLCMCKHYAIFDSDCYFITDFHFSDFMYDDNTPYFSLKEVANSDSAYVTIKNLLGRNGKNYDFIIQGQVFSASTLKKIEQKYLKPRKQTWLDLLHICPYEFNWYGEFVMYFGDKYYYCAPKVKIFWFQQQYCDARRMGETINDYISQGYLAVLLQAGWCRDEIFKPSPLNKIIRWCRKISFIWNDRNVYHKNLFVRFNRFLKSIKKGK